MSAGRGAPAAWLAAAALGAAACAQTAVPRDAGDTTRFACLGLTCVAGRDRCEPVTLPTGDAACVPRAAPCPSSVRPRCSGGFTCERALNCGVGEVCCASFGPAVTDPPVYDAGCPVPLPDGGFSPSYPIWRCTLDRTRRCTHATLPVCEQCCGPSGFVNAFTASCVPTELCPRDALRCTTDDDCPADAPRCRVVAEARGVQVRLCRP